VTRSLASWTLWWLVLLGLWIVIEGTVEAMEVAAGAAAAAVAASLAELLRRRGLLRYAPDPAWLAKVVRLFWRVPYEFGLVTEALVLDLLRMRRVRSAWLAVPFRAPGPPARAAGTRAAALVLENVSPNTMAADANAERRLALKHDLVQGRGSSVLPS
jgi:hypothetical protein